MIARDARFFEYLALPESRCKVVIGDGRLGIQQAEAGSFDMILLDAFSSGTIPVHLLTKEAVQTYLSKLAPGGFLAFHISNHFLNLTPALSSIASELGLRILEREDRHAFYGKEAAHYAVMFPPTSHPKFLEQHPVWKQISPEQTAQVWTDEYSNLTSLVKW
jgi:spermidine synthase